MPSIKSAIRTALDRHVEGVKLASDRSGDYTPMIFAFDVDLNSIVDDIATAVANEIDRQRIVSQAVHGRHCFVSIVSRPATENHCKKGTK